MDIGAIFLKSDCSYALFDWAREHFNGKEFHFVQGDCVPFGFLEFKPMILGHYGEWHYFLIDPHLLEQKFVDGELEAALSKLSAKGDLFMIKSHLLSGELLFEYHQDGSLMRKWQEANEAVLVNQGIPLSEEDGSFNDEWDPDDYRDEWSLVDLAEKVTHIHWA